MTNIDRLTKDFSPADLSIFGENKLIPCLIRENALKALSFFPELINTDISFLLKPIIKSSVMQAQPVFTTLLYRRKQRRYRINISRQFRLIQSKMVVTSIPDDVMIGWIGHELGHIMDYERRSNVNMVAFGYKYYFHSSFVKHAEMLADSFAIERGMGDYILALKRFILNHPELPQRYKNKIARLYLSPDVIIEKVRQLEERKLQLSLVE